MQPPEHIGGSPAPVAGDYEQLNVFGSPSGVIVRVAAGERLPVVPVGFTWRKIEARE